MSIDEKKDLLGFLRQKHDEVLGVWFEAERQLVFMERLLVEAEKKVAGEDKLQITRRK